ncbi:tRNA pseudouridine(55) synthase TruB [Patescibacteria group bacterium]
MSQYKKEDLILIDKPKGITSFDVIRQLRRKLNIKKMGHAGTLDPNASGLMLIGVEKGTKKLKDLIGLDKTYIAEILLGKKTDTGDITGKVIEEKEIPELNEDAIKEVLKSLEGEQELEVSLYSAIKRKGKPLYKYARAGEKIEKPKRVMTVYSANLKSGVLDTPPIVKVEFDVGSGTYIRSLAEELGERLGTVATLQNLRRTKIGNFEIKDAEKL